jgi:hypothetical protein
MRRLEPRRATSKALKDSDYKCEPQCEPQLALRSAFNAVVAEFAMVEHPYAAFVTSRLAVVRAHVGVVGALISSRPARPYGCIAEFINQIQKR